MKILALALTLTWGSLSWADTLNGSLEAGTTISREYDSRSVFTNPAALGYQTELNGSELLSAISYAASRNQSDSFAGSLSYGYGGIGLEKLGSSFPSTRLTAGFGFPLWGPVFAGLRYRYSLSDTPALDRLSSFDFGLQLRPSRIFSIGAVLVKPNRDSASYGPSQGKVAFGGTIRPLAPLELFGDIEVPFHASGTEIGYQFGASVTPLSGLTLRAGYHRQYEFQVGLQWNFDYASLFSTMQTGSDTNRLIVGAQFSGTPFKSTPLASRALHLSIDGKLREEPRFSSFFIEGNPSLMETVAAIRDASNQANTSAITIHLQRFPLGLAAAQDIADALWAAREKGKQIEVLIGQAGLPEYLIGSVAHRLTMEPSGELKLSGLGLERLFARGTLDKIGIEPEFLARGEFKTAPETFTRRESSPQNRTSTLEEMRTAEQALLAALKKFRNIDDKSWKRITSHAIFSAQDALQFKLIDAIAIKSVHEDRLAALYVERDDTTEKKDDLALPPQVAVIAAEGDILGHRMRSLTLAGHEQITPTKFGERLAEAVSDSRVKAIVLRVNSPGGEVLASHQIAALVERAKKRKPVVISMGDFAASGGYMISAPANAIFAQPLTITGSIGVFLGKMSARDLLKKIDLNTELLSESPNAGIYSMYRPWTSSQREIMTRRLNQYYESFTAYVAEHRGLSSPAVEAAAQGRVWMGTKAKGQKLVDFEGGLLQAAAHAAKLANIAERYEILPMGTQLGLMDALSPDSVLASASELDSFSSLVPKDIYRSLYFAEQSSVHPFWYLAPFTELR